MTDATVPQNKDRDQELTDWDKQTSASIIAENRKKKINGLIIGAMVLLGLVAVMVFKGSAQKASAPQAPLNLSSTPHKPLPELKANILHQQPPAPVAETPIMQSVDPLQGQREQLEMQRTEKARLLLEARLKSAIDPDMSSNQAHQSNPPGAPMTMGYGTLPDGAGGQGAQDANSRFTRAVSGKGVPASEASNITQLDHKILQGKVIEAVTVPRAISDLPGTVCAIVQRDVYAERGRNKLIPWGSRMCGVYSAELRKGQNRLFTIWKALRVSNADGSISEVALDSIGSDQLGSAGMGGIVDSHFAEIFGTSALLSIIGAGAANAGVSSSDQSNSAAQYRESVQQAAAQTSQSVLAPYVNIPPTVTVPAGSRIRIFVNRDLDFSTLYKEQSIADKAQRDEDLFD